MKNTFAWLLLLMLPFSLFADDDLFFAENEGITVLGTVQTSQQISILEKEQIEDSGSGDITNLLQEKLGLNITRYGAYGNQTWINIRGFDSKRIAFLIDGVPVNSSLDGKFDINQIDLSTIEKIEVVHGGSDSKHNVSGAFGGVINIITVKKQKNGLRLTASVSNTSMMPGIYRNREGEMQDPHWEDLFDTQHYSLSAAYGSENFSLTSNIFANRAENHFIFLDKIDRLRRKDNNEVWDAGASFSLVWDLNDLTKLITSSNFYYGDSNFPASGFSSRVGNQQDFSTRQYIMLDTPRAFHDKFASEASFAWQFQRRDYTSSAAVNSIHDQHCLSVINRWSWFAGDALTLRSGKDYSFIRLDSIEIGNRSRHDSGLSLTAEFKPVQTLMIIPSFKVIFTSEGAQDFALIPKLGLLWIASDNLIIKNNYFRSFKFPDFEELYWNGAGGIGNPDLYPEDGWGADIGAAWRLTESIHLENVFFTQWIRNSIHWFANSGGIWRPENVGEAVFFGLDSKVNLEIPVSSGPLKKITASLSYQYLLSRLLSYGYTFDSGKRIPYNPEHTIASTLGFSWESGSFYISGHYESQRFHDTANLTTLKPLLLFNAGANQKTGEHLTFFGSLRNILNTSYESFYDYPMPGITLTLGLRATLEAK